MRPPLVRDPTAFNLSGLQALVGRRAIARLERLARSLHVVFQGGGAATVWHVNSSPVGGGVADILNSLVSLSTRLGVETTWLVLGGDERFFEVTKAFHNALQGDASVRITDGMVAHYRAVTSASARRLEELCALRSSRPPDVIVFHDPQPVGIISHWRATFPHAIFVWQGHIHFDVAALTSPGAGGRVWKLLVSDVNRCDVAVFHLPDQVPHGLTIPVRCFLPAIDPTGYINRNLTGPAGDRFIDGTLRKYGMEALADRSIPLVTQVGRFDPWKDPAGVLQAYREATERVSRRGRRPHLLLTGPLAPDDPQAFSVLTQLTDTVNGDGTVHIVPLSPNGHGATAEQAAALEELGVDHRVCRAEDLMDLEINAFQTRADVLVAKSLREGFGLAVTGAGYHGKARIVSRIGGLQAQVIDERGRVHACLVGGVPRFSREASIRMTRDWLIKLLSSPRLRSRLGAGAKRHVIRAFLPHRQLEDYFRLFLDIRLRSRRAANWKAVREPSMEVSAADAFARGGR